MYYKWPPAAADLLACSLLIQELTTSFGTEDIPSYLGFFLGRLATAMYVQAGV
jgi:hypothetical protein